MWYYLSSVNEYPFNHESITGAIYAKVQEANDFLVSKGIMMWNQMVTVGFASSSQNNKSWQKSLLGSCYKAAFFRNKRNQVTETEAMVTTLQKEEKGRKWKGWKPAFKKYLQRSWRQSEDKRGERDKLCNKIKQYYPKINIQLPTSHSYTFVVLVETEVYSLIPKKTDLLD